MKTATGNWESVPLLRAETKVITTPTKTAHESNCPGWDGLRFNIGNIPEIKQIRNVPAAN